MGGKRVCRDDADAWPDWMSAGKRTEIGALAIPSLNADEALFVDADGNGVLSNSHEYVFTEWAGGASDDLDALRKVFDSNGDGKLTIRNLAKDPKRSLYRE